MSTQKNTDLILDLVLQEDDLEDGTAGPALDYSTFAGVLIILYQSIGKPLLKWSKVIPGGNPDNLKPIEVTSAVDGKIFVRVPRSLTRSMTSAEYYLEVMVADTDVDAEAGLFYTIASGIEVDLLRESVGNKLTIPT